MGSNSTVFNGESEGGSCNSSGVPKPPPCASYRSLLRETHSSKTSKLVGSGQYEVSKATFKVSHDQSLYHTGGSKNTFKRCQVTCTIFDVKPGTSIQRTRFTSYGRSHVSHHCQQGLRHTLNRVKDVKIKYGCRLPPNTFG